MEFAPYIYQLNTFHLLITSSFSFTLSILDNDIAVHIIDLKRLRPRFQVYANEKKFSKIKPKQ